MKKRKKVPEFENEAQERAFWSEEDSTGYVDWDQAQVAVFPRLKPTTRTISLRLPEYILEELRTLANKRDVPYQSLIKIYLKDRIDQELHAHS